MTKQINITSVSANKHLCDEFGGELTYKELAGLVGFLGMKKNKSKTIRNITYFKGVQK